MTSWMAFTPLGKTMYLVNRSIVPLCGVEETNILSTRYDSTSVVTNYLGTTSKPSQLPTPEPM